MLPSRCPPCRRIPTCSIGSVSRCRSLARRPETWCIDGCASPSRGTSASTTACSSPPGCCPRGSVKEYVTEALATRRGRRHEAAPTRGARRGSDLEARVKPARGAGELAAGRSGRPTNAVSARLGGIGLLCHSDGSRAPVSGPPPGGRERERCTDAGHGRRRADGPAVPVGPARVAFLSGEPGEHRSARGRVSRSHR